MKNGRAGIRLYGRRESAKSFDSTSSSCIFFFKKKNIPCLPSGILTNRLSQLLHPISGYFHNRISKLVTILLTLKTRGNGVFWLFFKGQKYIDRIGIHPSWKLFQLNLEAMTTHWFFFLVLVINFLSTDDRSPSTIMSFNSWRLK